MTVKRIGGGTMNNLELCVRVTKVGIGTVNLNNFIRTIVEVAVGEMTNFVALVPIFISVEEGTYLKSTNWAITTWDKVGENKDKDKKLAIRFDEASIVDEKEGVISPKLNAKITGMVLKSDKCTLQYITPMRKPFYRCTLRIVDEFKNPYSCLLVSFKDAALKLSNIPRQTIVRAIVNIRPQKWCEDYEMCADSFKEAIDDKKYEDLLSED